MSIKNKYNDNEKCLLIVDVQKGFINGYTKHILDNMSNLLESFNIIFATKFYNKTGSFYDTLINWGHVRKDTDEFNLAFSPDDKTEIIEKSVYSCVTPDFVKRLKDNYIEKVYICGIDTDVCVTKCAVDLFENGIIPIVIENYCASTAGMQAHICGISTIKRYIGTKQVITFR